MKRIIILLMIVGAVRAHEMVPTYPTWETTYVDGVLKTTMELFNKRDDVEYYEIGVFDEAFWPIPFVTTYKVLKVKYLSHVDVDIYIKKEDKDKAMYICSKSKIKKEEVIRTAVSSRICSKFKKDL